MSEKAADELVDTPRERGARYIVEQGGQPVAVLLALDEYTHYLELQDDEADSLDPELAARLVQAASPSTDPSTPSCAPPPPSLAATLAAPPAPGFHSQQPRHELRRDDRLEGEPHASVWPHLST